MKKSFLNCLLLHRILIVSIVSCFALLPSGICAEDENLHARLELFYHDGVENLNAESMLSAKVCFDLLREEANYNAPFKYQLSLFCNGKKVARESHTFEPPEGIAIKRTTVCKTFNFSLKDIIPATAPMVSVKAHVVINEADRSKIKAESGLVEARLRSEYEELTASGTIICPSGFPLNLVKIQLYGMEPGKIIVPYDSRAKTFSDRRGSFSVRMPAPSGKNSQVMAHLFCPESDAPSLTITGNVSHNTCSFGTVQLSCISCIGPLSAGEIEQMLPPRSPASETSRY